MASRMLNRVIANRRNLLVHKDGALILLGIYGRIMPVLTLVMMEKMLNDNVGEKKISDILYLVGEMQGYNGAILSVKKVGMPLEGNELNVFRYTAGHGEMTGLGKARILKFDLKNKIIIAEVVNNPFTEYYYRLFGPVKYCVDHYLRGLYGGTAKYVFKDDNFVVIGEHSKDNYKKTLYRIMPVEKAVGKYGMDTVKFFVPDKNIDASSLKTANFKRFVL